MTNTTMTHQLDRQNATNESQKTAADHNAIIRIIQLYIDGAKSGKGDEMKPAFHSDATIYGYFGEDLLAGNIDLLFTWNDDNGAATGLEARIVSVDIVDTVATVRLELDDWTGHRFTDMFTLLKIDGQWKITSKVFHLHS